MPSDYTRFKLVNVENLGSFVYRVSLNRPKKYNALNMAIWNEIGQVFQKIDVDPECRCVLLEGEGKHFSSGLDLSDSPFPESNDTEDQARKSRTLLRTVKHMQKQFTLIEECSKPVIALIHGYCIGGGIDIITACDVRFCSNDAVFSVKEVDIGMAADVGTLNRLPKVVGNHSWVKDVSLSGRLFKAEEALQFGLVSRVFPSRQQMQTEAISHANLISSKSPIGVQGTKIVLNYAREHTTDDSLNFVATWNMSQLFTEDLAKSAMASMSKQPLPPFSKL